jgi:alkylated DNA repair dioxygenase AlkB
MNKIDITPNSWYILSNLEKDKISKEFYKKLWDIHPNSYSTIMLFNKEINMPRYSQSYGCPYFYSGVLHESVDTPDILKPLTEYINQLGFGEFNQILVNWYENGHHYIGKHRDNEKSLIPESPIVSISLGSTRTFRLRSYEKMYNFEKNQIIKDIPLTDGTLFIMGGKFQKEITHEIPRINGQKVLNTHSRINITFRKMKTL